MSEFIEASLIALQNCNATADWLVEYWRSEDIPMRRVITMFQGIVFNSSSGNVVDLSTNSSTAAWILDYMDQDDLWREIITEALLKCNRAVCDKIRWKGNSDVAGVGVCGLLCWSVLS